MAPNLFIHDRQQRQAPLSSHAVSALVSTFTEGGEATPQRGRDAQDVLRTVRSSEHWLSCTCVDDADGGPLMSPRLLPSGVLTLVRHGRVSHTEACPFHALRTPAEEIQPARSYLSDLLAQILVAADAELPPLLRRCSASILDACGYTRVQATAVRSTPGEHGSVGHTDVTGHYGQTDQVNDTVVGEGRVLSDVWCTHVASIARMLPRWRAQALSKGIFFGVVNRLDGDELVRAPKTGPEARIRCAQITFRARGCDGPFWACGRVDVALGTLDQVYVWPVVSAAALMPVESERDREVARVLWGQIAYWHAAKARTYTLVKPIDDEIGADAADFSLEWTDRTIAIDVVALPGHHRSRSETMVRVARRNATEQLSFVVDDEPVDVWRKALTSAALRGR